MVSACLNLFIHNLIFSPLFSPLILCVPNTLLALSYATQHDCIFVTPGVLTALTEPCISSNEEALVHASTSVHQYTYVRYREVLSCVVLPSLLYSA